MSRDARITLAEAARQILAASAGAIAIVYVLGGLVVSLRLFLAGLPALSLLGSLPRQSLVTTGLAEVVAPALLAGTVAWAAAIAFPSEERHARHSTFKEKPNAQAKVMHCGEAIALALLLLGPGLAVSVQRSAPWRSGRGGWVAVVAFLVLVSWSLLYM